MNALHRFAERYRVKVKQDCCGDPIIPGKKRAKDMPDRPEYRCHVYEHGFGQFGLLLLLETKRHWNNARRKLESAGFTISQNADTEGAALFDPANDAQAKLALTLAGVKRRRSLSPEQRQSLADRLRIARGLPKAPVEGRFPALESTYSPLAAQSTT